MLYKKGIKRIEAVGGNRKYVRSGEEDSLCARVTFAMGIDARRESFEFCFHCIIIFISYIFSASNMNFNLIFVFYLYRCFTQSKYNMKDIFLSKILNN